jgi:hypothetical protein
MVEENVRMETCGKEKSWMSQKKLEKKFEHSIRILRTTREIRERQTSMENEVLR